MKSSRRGWLALLALAVCLMPAPADAYVGPGSGVTVIGAALSLVGAVILAIVGFVWYPIKRLLRRFKQSGQPQGVDSSAL